MPGGKEATDKEARTRNRKFQDPNPVPRLWRGAMGTTDADVRR